MFHSVSEYSNRDYSEKVCILVNAVYCIELDITLLKKFYQIVIP